MFGDADHFVFITFVMAIAPDRDDNCSGVHGVPDAACWGVIEAAAKTTL
jgi:hypothetical protein